MKIKLCPVLVLIAFSPVFAPKPLRAQTVRKSPQQMISGAVIKQAAEANLVNAQAYNEFAKATGEMATSLQQEVDLDMKTFRAYWQKKQERLAIDRKLVEQRIENQTLSEVRRRAQVAQQWDSLYANPNAYQIAALNGNALNFMLEQLAVHTTLAYSPDLPSAIELLGDNTFQPSADCIEAIRITVPSSMGGNVSMKLTEPIPLDLSWWPHLLMAAEFDEHRNRLTQLRINFVDAVRARSKVSHKEIAEIETAMAALTSAFFRQYPPNKRKGLSSREYHQIFQAEDHLRQLDQDVNRVVLSGTSAAFQADAFKPDRDSAHLGALLHYMLRNNLRFAPARPSEEAHYVTLTNMAKQFCTLAEVSPDGQWIEAGQIKLGLQVDQDPEVDKLDK